MTYSTVRRRQQIEACERFLSKTPLKERDYRYLPKELLYDLKVRDLMNFEIDIGLTAINALYDKLNELQRLVREAAEKKIEDVERILLVEIRARMNKRECKLVAEHDRRRHAILEDLESNAHLTFDVDATDSHPEQMKFPRPPKSTITPVKKKESSRLPGKSGVYFVWRDEEIWYVGQSICISQRCSLGTHHIIHPDDKLSYLRFPIHWLDFAEAFYIGICRPPANSRRWRGYLARS